MNRKITLPRTRQNVLCIWGVWMRSWKNESKRKKKSMHRACSEWTKICVPLLCHWVCCIFSLRRLSIQDNHKDVVTISIFQNRDELDFYSKQDSFLDFCSFSTVHCIPVSKFTVEKSTSNDETRTDNLKFAHSHYDIKNLVIVPASYNFTFFFIDSILR